MVDKQKTLLENALSNVLEDLDKSHLRHLQAEMHKCAAKCCENTAVSIEQNYRCVEKCAVKSEQAEEYVVTQFISFLAQLQKCADKCNDDVKSKMGAKVSEGKYSKFKSEIDNCLVVCVEKHIAILPNFVKHVKDELAK